ncbi:glycerate kinase [Alteribacter natronophilus]|uniref:glycerate kinase n=1 Tax=Alteribacter natronophilus TaxID=2583810 RepID=UPI00110F16FC|nr:glycerate kinase [Alteribacter natronophilus]TMW72848.1 glycerate kinase [Alteribacter natronophilus]
MKIVIAPDSFKESLSAYEASNAIEKGFRKVFPDADYIKIPMADGGEGTVHALVYATGGSIVERKVTGPLGVPVDAHYGILGDGKTAVVEMASASGLHHVPQHERNPLLTTTFGTGELLLDAVEHGAEKIIIGIGGSATNDGGAGMIQAIGGRLLDREGRQIRPGGTGLADLVSADLTQIDERLTQVTLEVACDVDIPLTGSNGASAVFGPQKGADSGMIELLDQNLEIFADVLEVNAGREERNTPGAGAAGGLGFGLLSVLSAELKSGVDIVLDAVKFESVISDASLVITGEGRIDQQTAHGKTPAGVAKAAKKHGIPVIGIAGSVSTESGTIQGIDRLFSIVPGAVPLENAMANAAEYTEFTSENIAGIIEVGINQHRNSRKAADRLPTYNG